MRISHSLEEAIEFMRSRGLSGISMPYAAINQMDAEGRIEASVVYHSRTECDTHASIAVRTGASLQRRFMFAIFDYPYNVIGVRRISVHVRSSNLRSLMLAEDMGFTEEGRKKKWYPSGCDMIMLGQLKEECGWLTKLAKHYGKRV